MIKIKYLIICVVALLVSATSYSSSVKLPEDWDILKTTGQPSLKEVQLNTPYDLLVWNVFKAKKKNWNSEFQSIFEKNALSWILLQEGVDRSGVWDFLTHQSDWEWNLATSFFDRKEMRTGVLSGSTFPSDTHWVRSDVVEPIFQTPKMTLVQSFKIEDGRSLLMINTHAINFVNAFKYEKHILQIKDEMDHHTGPMIWAGDFNNWTKKRSNILKELTFSHHLNQILFTPDRRSRIFGRQIDHIFARGIEPIKAWSQKIKNASDHHPLFLRFRIQP